MRFITIFAVLGSWIVFSGNLAGQDITPAEIEKSQEIREKLIRNGFLQEDSDTPVVQFSSVEPVVQYSEYTGDRLSVSTEGSRASDFNDSGNRFYTLGRSSQNIAEYHLSSSWNIESADYVRELDISSEMGTAVQDGSKPHGLYFRKSDGKKMWVLNRTEIWEYTLSTPWDISSASQTGYKDLSDHVVRGHDIDFRPNGNVLYVDDRVTEVVFQYNLSSSWDVETASLDYAFDISGQQEQVRGTQFSPDGNRMFLMDTERQEVLEYYVSDSFDLRSASFNGSFSVASQSSNPRGLTFRPNLSRYYVTDNTDNIVYEYRILIVDPDNSTLSSSKDKVVANGDATSRITVTLRDQNGDRINGRKVSLSSNSSNTIISSVNSTTNSSGEARFDVSGEKAETVTFTASSMGVTIDETATIRFVTVDDKESTVEVNKEKVIADGSSTSRITVTARDVDGDRLEDVRVSLNSNSSEVDINNDSKDTDSNGEATFDVSNDTAEAVTFTAVGMGVTIDETVTVRFVTVDADESSVASGRQKVQANGIESSKITVIVRDEDGDELQDVEISLVPDEGSSEIEKLQNPTNSDGVAEFRVTNNVAEVVEYRARGFGVTIDDRVSVNFIPIDADESAMKISTQKILANGKAEATITVTARDEFGEPFSNTDINLQQSGGNSEVSNVQKTTDSDGIAIFRVKSNNVGEITYSASTLGVTVGQTVSARFVTVDPGESTVAVSPENVQANGDEESQITVTTRDEDGDALQGARVVLEDLNGSSVIDDSEITTNADGMAVFTVTSETPQIVNYRITAEGIEFSENISVGFIPIAPVALTASDVKTREFDANW
ncbi:MAG: Ig-like domain-containing protein, partial [Balneolaceae bacterium]|nr:Ig-like domain-containing protein [Balneolaceae bacterium]